MQEQPAHGYAVASLALGIIAIVLWFFGYSTIISFILGLVGIILASNAKKAGNTEGIRTAGFICSLVGMLGGIIAFLACVACIGGAAMLGSAMQ